MTFTGNSSNKINYKSSNFFVDFYQLDANHSKRIWESRVFINDSQLHTVGQHLGESMIMSNFLINRTLSSDRRHLLKCPNVRLSPPWQGRLYRESSGCLFSICQDEEEQTNWYWGLADSSPHHVRITINDKYSRPEVIRACSSTNPASTWEWWKDQNALRTPRIRC